MAISDHGLEQHFNKQTKRLTDDVSGKNQETLQADKHQDSKNCRRVVEVTISDHGLEQQFNNHTKRLTDDVSNNNQETLQADKHQDSRN